MMNEIAQIPAADKIKKLYVKETILFAINNIPGVDPATLEKFLELVNATGTFGSMSHEEILAKMEQMMKYVPGTSIRSLLILIDLLEINVSPRQNFPALLSASSRMRALPSRKVE